MLAFPLETIGQQIPEPGKEPLVSVQLQNVPLRSALNSLFNGTGYQFTVEPAVSNITVSLVLKDVDLEAALKLLMKQVVLTQPSTYVEKKAGIYLIRTRDTPDPMTNPMLEFPGNGREPTVSMQLRSVPFRSVIDSLFKSTGYQYALDPNVSNVPISVVMKDIGFEAALRQLISLAAVLQPGVYLEKKFGAYAIKAREIPASDPEAVVAKFPVKFQNADDLIKQLERLGVTREVESVLSLPRENAVLIKGTRDEIVKLREIIELMDVPVQMLSIRIGVTGPGVGNRPFQLGSMARTLNGKEVVIDEQTTAGGEMARLRVQVRPIMQGDGEILTESDWDISIPVAGGPKGPLRLVKRLTTSARLQSGRALTIGEVDLAPFGGAGTVKLWLRGEIVSSSPVVRATTGYGEEIGLVRMLDGKPYLAAMELAASLGGQFRRSAAGGYELRPGLAKDAYQLLPAESPIHAGPYRFSREGRLLSSNLVWANDEPNNLRLDAGGSPMLPLEDIARVLSGRLKYDSATDRYLIQGGSRFGTLRFPAGVAKDR
jgi:hypothetical protein